MAKATPRARLPEHLLALRDRYVTVAGEIAHVAVEKHSDPLKIDHVWITIRAGEFGRIDISLSTSSRQNRAAGFDPRLRVGMIESTWTELPPAGIRLSAGLDYAQLEAASRVEYEAYGRTALEEFLMRKAQAARYAEAWGEFYVRAHVGVHQIHSRRASEAVPRDVIGQDGALRLYFAEPRNCEMLLFKFCGQP
jgi:hypothetical protein